MNSDRIQALSRALIFLGLVFVCSVTASVLAGLVSPLFFSEGVSVIPGGALPSSDSDWWQLHFQNLISQALGFGGAVWVAAALWKRSVPIGLNTNRRAMAPWGLILVVMATLFSSPLMALLYEWNVMAIPEGSVLEAALKPIEEMLEKVTTFLVTAEGSRRIIVIISVALVPAVFEELAFRGALQPLLIRATGKPWLGIAIASVIFSAIHFQFYGFLPRVFLGALFGWFAYRSGSIVPGMLAHFVNNALAALTLWYTGSMTEDLFEVETWTVVVSLALTTAIFVAYHRFMPAVVSDDQAHPKHLEG